MTTESEPRYQVRRVTTRRVDDGDGWVVETHGEWQVLDTLHDQVVMTFPWSVKEDNTEWPERTYRTGPLEVSVDEESRRVICRHTMEDAVGFRFEGQAGAFSTRAHDLPEE